MEEIFRFSIGAFPVFAGLCILCSILNFNELSTTFFVISLLLIVIAGISGYFIPSKNRIVVRG